MFGQLDKKIILFLLVKIKEPLNRIEIVSLQKIYAVG